MINFKNTYSKLPQDFFKRVKPGVFSNPSLLVFNYDLAKELDIEPEKDELELARIFSGQTILEGSEPLAMAYAGHQFGGFNPQLGDGRAMLLGETKGFDIQLKGAGHTPFSRSGDGKSALGPVVREYIVSEAMHNLGVPTTRALAAVITGDDVFRNGTEPGGIFTRVASSHLRVGTFQYFSSRNEYDSVETLMNYAISRHYPNADSPLSFLKEVAVAQAALVSKWMGLGFIHGVMNTDNSSIAGITIDYGPCAFMDEFKFNKVFSSIDHQGRYSYSNQGQLTHWNILRLAETLIPLIDSDTDKAVKKIEECLSFLPELIQDSLHKEIANKLGLKEMDKNLTESFFNYLEKESLDFTLAFRNLPDLFNDSSIFYPKTELLDEFISKWKPKADIENLHLINPLYIPRNHQIQKVIDDVYAGDFKSFHELDAVLKTPFIKNEELHHYSVPPIESQRIGATFCGT